LHIFYAETRQTVKAKGKTKGRLFVFTCPFLTRVANFFRVASQSGGEFLATSLPARGPRAA